MNIWIINFWAETFNSGDEGTRYTYHRAFKNYDEAVEYVKQKFIPKITQETKDFYPGEDVEIRFLHQGDDSWTLGVFINNEQLEVMGIDVDHVYIEEV